MRCTNFERLSSNGRERGGGEIGSTTRSSACCFPMSLARNVRGGLRVEHRANEASDESSVLPGRKLFERFLSLIHDEVTLSRVKRRKRMRIKRGEYDFSRSYISVVWQSLARASVDAIWKNQPRLG